MTEDVVRTVGCLEVVPLLDTSGPVTFSRGAVFSGASRDEWLLAEHLDPGARGSDGSWHLSFRCFAVRRPDGGVTLVDTGVGPDPGTVPWAPGPGRLPQALQKAGMDVSDVDVVVLTHLHADHVGWAVVAGAPMFPAARYLVQRDELGHAAQQRSDGGVYETTVLPLQRSGQLEAVDGVAPLPGGAGGSEATVTVLPAPGHSVGHQCVVVSSREQRVVITGDVVVHAVQLVNPSVAYEYEHDQGQAARTRRHVFDLARRRPTLLASAHLTEPFTSVPSDADPNGGFRTV